MKKKLTEHIISAVLAGTTYSGNKNAGKRILSASSLAKDDLQIYLTFLHGFDKPERIELNTLGTLVHTGLEEIFKGAENVDIEDRYNVELSNGWTISGSIDSLFHDMEAIVDWKVPNMKILKEEIRKFGKSSKYALQMGVYKWLIWKVKGLEYNAYLGTFDKKQSHFAKDSNKDVFGLIEIETYNFEEIEALLIEKTDRLDIYIESNIEPEQCKIIWSAQYGTKKIPATCRFYCSVSSNCKFYQKYKKGSDVNKIKNMLGVIKKKRPPSAVPITGSKL